MQVQLVSLTLGSVALVSVLLRTNLLVSEFFETSGQRVQSSLCQDFLQFRYKMLLLCYVAKGCSHHLPQAALGMSAKRYLEPPNLEAQPSSIVSEKKVKGF